MEGIAPPPKFNMNAVNLNEEWKTFKQEMQFYLVASEKDSKSNSIKVSFLLHCMGKEVIQVYNTFVFDPVTDNMVYNKVIEMMDDYFSPKKNITLMRYTFFTCRQEEFERFHQFVIKLKTLVRDCDLGTLQGELVKDMIVIGTCDSRLQEQLLSKSDLTLEMAIKVGQTAEATKKNLEISHLLMVNLQAIRTTLSVTVNIVLFLMFVADVLLIIKLVIVEKGAILREDVKVKLLIN